MPIQVTSDAVVFVGRKRYDRFSVRRAPEGNTKPKARDTTWLEPPNKWVTNWMVSYADAEGRFLVSLTRNGPDSASTRIYQFCLTEPRELERCGTPTSLETRRMGTDIRGKGALAIVWGDGETAVVTTSERGPVVERGPSMPKNTWLISSDGEVANQTTEVSGERLDIRSHRLKGAELATVVLRTPFNRSDFVRLTTSPDREVYYVSNLYEQFVFATDGSELGRVDPSIHPRMSWKLPTGSAHAVQWERGCVLWSKRGKRLVDDVVCEVAAGAWDSESVETEHGTVVFFESVPSAR